MPICLFGVSVVAIVGLFSSFVLFPSLLEEGAAKPQGKGSLLLGNTSPLGALRAEGINREKATDSGSLGGGESGNVSDIQGLCKGINKIPNNIPQRV